MCNCGRSSLQGKSRILSTPRVVTQNNVQADDQAGHSRSRFRSISNNTVTVTFIDALLKLVVTPQITAASTVIMRIFVEKAVAQLLPDHTGGPDARRSIRNARSPPCWSPMATRR